LREAVGVGADRFVAGMLGVAVAVLEKVRTEVREDRGVPGGVDVTDITCKEHTSTL